MYAKTDSRDSERPEKARRNDFRTRVPAGKRHERERQRNSPRCAGKIKGRYRKKPAEKVGFYFFRWFTLFYAPLLGWLVFVYKVFYKSVYALSRVVTGVSRN